MARTRTRSTSAWPGVDSNYYNNPVITNVTITSDGNMRLQGKTNGSTILAEGYQSYGFIAEVGGEPDHYEFSVATAENAPTFTSDGQSGWNFDIEIQHTNGSLVLDPQNVGGNVAQGGKIFDGFAVVDPHDAQSYIKISYDGE